MNPHAYRCDKRKISWDCLCTCDANAPAVGINSPRALATRRLTELNRQLTEACVALGRALLAEDTEKINAKITEGKIIEARIEEVKSILDFL